MIICSVLTVVVLALGWIIFNKRAGSRYRVLDSIDMKGMRFRKLHAPFLDLIEKLQLTRKLPMLVYRIQHSVQRVYGLKHSNEKTLLFIAEMLVYSWLSLIAGALLTLVLEGDPLGLIAGALLAGVIPFAQMKDLHHKVKLREQDILMELPEFLNKIVLLVSAGETVQRAILHCTERKKDLLTRSILSWVRWWESGTTDTLFNRHLSSSVSDVECRRFLFSPRRCS